jgi:hypothetical protein
MFPAVDHLKGLTLNEIMTDEIRRVIILLETEKDDTSIPDKNEDSSRYLLSKLLH